MYTVRTELSTLREMVTTMEEKAFQEKQASLIVSGTAGRSASVGAQYRHPQQRHGHLHPGQEMARMNEFNSQLKYLQNILNGGLHFNS